MRILFISLLCIVTFQSCNNKATPEVKKVAISQSEDTKSNALDSTITYAKVEFAIEGMTCEMGCAKTIEKKIAKMDGVKSAKVDFGKRMAMVEYDEAKVNPESLEKTVTKVGKVYKVKDMKTVDAFSSED